ncbi:nuclear transport factor 2 family protein [Actibacterium sp. 188UL27-1]|uniref:nuclear transport factor 2 family protein n=1 Tax=Actibacterium sp. 188UL27-1 TaxID=2786961 RepID=UPI00195A9FDA|nr:nuclear transport factor 2 family protein [Actibacterium sp. 188UL27-1]MBM7067754.1 nuclear transport factor 2 family protein [Actibacterium sp. 188UL27-1]
MTPKKTVLAYWQTMATNDFTAASQYLAPGFWCHWPQSAELIRGRENFAALNANYPAHGIWQFDVKRIAADGQVVMTEVDITDGVQTAKALTWHRVVDGKIAHQVEYWPDPYDAPANRSQWVETVADTPV